MRNDELDILLREELGREECLPVQLDMVVQKKMKQVNCKKARTRLIVLIAIGLIVTTVDIYILFKLFSTLELKIITLGLYTFVIPLLLFFAILSSTNNKLNNKNIHHGYR